MKTRIATGLSDMLRHGTTPQKLALSLAVGMSIGILPLLGWATMFCTIAAIVFRLNLRAVQTANYIVYPLQIVLILPLVRLGGKMFGAKSFPLYPPQLSTMLQHNMFGTLRALGHTAEHGLAAWMLVGPVSMAVIYFAVNPYLLSLATKPAPLPEKARAAAAR